MVSKKKKTLSKVKKKTLSKVKKKADAVFSKWIRARDKRCVTCSSKNNLQAGHYVSRSVNQLRFNEYTVHSQCVGCNVFKYGHMDEYARFMIKKYGADILDTLAKEKVKLKRWSIAELEEIIEKYNL